MDFHRNKEYKIDNDMINRFQLRECFNYVEIGINWLKSNLQHFKVRSDGRKYEMLRRSSVRISSKTVIVAVCVDAIYPV